MCGISDRRPEVAAAMLADINIGVVLLAFRVRINML